MTVRMRNVDAAPSDPVVTWPYEALVEAIERGSVTDWARLSAEIRRDPWGAVADNVTEYLSYEMPYGVGPLLARAVEMARVETAAAERREVARRVNAMIAESGLSAAEFARRVGTSGSRLSTYRSAKVVPSATMLLRMERLAASLSRQRSTA